MTTKPTKTTKTRKTPTRRRTVKKAATLTASARGLAGKVEGASSRALSMVESMPRAQRNRVASISIAVGAGLYLFGAPRIVAFLALIPAIALGGRQMARGLGRR